MQYEIEAIYEIDVYQSRPKQYLQTIRWSTWSARLFTTAEIDEYLQIVISSRIRWSFVQIMISSMNTWTTCLVQIAMTAGIQGRWRDDGRDLHLMEDLVDPRKRAR